MSFQSVLMWELGKERKPLGEMKIDEKADQEIWKENYFLISWEKKSSPHRKLVSQIESISSWHFEGKLISAKEIWERICMFCANFPPQVFSSNKSLFLEKPVNKKHFPTCNDDNVTLVTMIDCQSGKQRRSWRRRCAERRRTQRVLRWKRIYNICWNGHREKFAL